MIAAKQIRDEGRLLNAFGGYDEIEQLCRSAANQLEAQQIVIVALQRVFALVIDIDEVKLADWIHDTYEQALTQLTKGTPNP
jgi:hypothetical protein